MKEYDEGYEMYLKDVYQDRMDRQKNFNMMNPQGFNMMDPQGFNMMGPQNFNMMGHQGFDSQWRPHWHGGFFPFRPVRPFWPFWLFGFPFFRDE